MTAAASAVVDLGTLGGLGEARPGRADYQVYRVKNAQAFDMPEMVSLFERAMGGDKGERMGMEVEQTLDYLKSHIQDPDEWIMFWVAVHKTKGFSGVIFLTYTPSPWCPFMNVTLLYVDHPSCRDKLIERAFLWARSKGHRMATLNNVTTHSDESFARIYRKYGKVKTTGSVLMMDMADRYTGG